MLSLFCRYLFQQDLLEVISSDSNIKPYSIICIQSYGNDKFLVAYETKGQTSGLYTCMQILRRSSSILQIKQAKVSPDLKGALCSDNNLHLDGWLIIDTNSVMNQREDCSLNGGFDMQVYDKSNFTGVCDRYIGETRLESECIIGEGLNFYFRQAACVPDGLHMYPMQRTYCLANWDDDMFNFILLKHDRMDHLWVLRYPKGISNGNIFKALLMKDLYSSTETSIPETNNYLILSMGNQIPKSLKSLCYDDYEICSALSNPCFHSEDVSRLCARTCGYCNDRKPAVCHFNISINGSWVDANYPEDIPHVWIDGTSVNITDTETLHCIDWTHGERKLTSVDHHLTQIDSGQISEMMLVSVSDNGCRPRFTCAKFTKLPNVFFMQLSQTRLWPLVLHSEDHYNCSDFKYTTNDDMDRNPYRKRQSTLFVPTKLTSVSCDLGRFSRFDVQFKGGTYCSGNIVQNPSKTMVQFHLSNCPTSVLTQTTFTCIEYANFSPQSDTLLVTRTNGTTPNIHCWLFLEKPSNAFYMVASEDCNGAMKRKIRKNRLRPIATFTKNESIIVTEGTTSQEELWSPSEHGKTISDTYTANISDMAVVNTNSIIESTVFATTIGEDRGKQTTHSRGFIEAHSEITPTDLSSSVTKMSHTLSESNTKAGNRPEILIPTTGSSKSSTIVQVTEDTQDATQKYFNEQNKETNTDNSIITEEITSTEKLSVLYIESNVGNNTYGSGNASAGYKDDHSGPSPAVAAAIVLTFIAFQVSIICKCSC